MMTGKSLGTAACGPQMTIYTDGGCWPNPGPGGWGFVCVESGDERSGGDLRTTNNRMEMTAVLEAIRYFLSQADRGSLKIYSDSEYVIRGCETWRYRWKKKGWKNVKNLDLWLKLDGHLDLMPVSFEWVRGHSNNQFNERADQLASAMIRGEAVVSRHEPVF